MEDNFNLQKRINEARFRFPYRYSILNQVVPAGGSALGQVEISADAHFDCLFMTGDFTTVSDGTDVDRCQISCKITDDGRNLVLFDSWIPLNLWLSPGRVRALGVAGVASNNLFYPIEFPYLFMATSVIDFDFRSGALTDNTVNIMLHGFKYRITPGQDAENWQEQS